jgi:hypothetical protein
MRVIVWAIILPATILSAPFAYFLAQRFIGERTIMALSAQAQTIVDTLTTATTAAQKACADLVVAQKAVETAASEATAQATEDLAAIGQAASTLASVFPTTGA